MFRHEHHVQLKEIKKYYELENLAIAHNLSKKGFDRFRYPFSPIGATFW
jgi:Xaa-Pro aminopeptidase